MRTIKPGTATDAAAIAHSITRLREARSLLREAGALTAAKAVARALKSADGARRHVGHRIRRSD